MLIKFQDDTNCEYLINTDQITFVYFNPENKELIVSFTDQKVISLEAEDALNLYQKLRFRAKSN